MRNVLVCYHIVIECFLIARHHSTRILDMEVLYNYYYFDMFRLNTLRLLFLPEIYLHNTSSY